MWLNNCFLTCWMYSINDNTNEKVQVNTQDSIKLKLEMLNATSIAIGAIEKTENEKEHFHAVALFPRSIRGDTLRNILGDYVHIEPMKKKEALEYINKEGNYYNNFDITIETDLYSSFLNDCILFDWKDILKKYPKLVINNYDNAKKIYYDLKNNEKNKAN